ncbi:hypothetical protein HY838_02355 [Candidatus Azambacteria bacterium]|nr:hypothetical protein [Candidatus Azambacteria bacterium]
MIVVFIIEIITKKIQKIKLPLSEHVNNIGKMEKIAKKLGDWINKQ